MQDLLSDFLDWVRQFTGFCLALVALDAWLVFMGLRIGRLQTGALAFVLRLMLALGYCALVVVVYRWQEHQVHGHKFGLTSVLVMLPILSWFATKAGTR